jgi:hypothetical protein
MRAGYSFKTQDALIAPAFSFTLFNAVTAGPELMVNTKRDQPVNFGVKAGYQYKFLEAGVGGWYQLYSTDSYDSYKNGFAPSVYAAAHWKLFFVQWEYLNEHKVSIGIREQLND